EIDKQTKQVFIGGEFFVVMGDTFLNKESMNQRAGFSENMQMLDAYIVSHDTYENTYVYHFPKSKKWVRLKISDGAVKCLGIVLDISNEMQDREKIEYERDHDVLTELLNRRAFHHKLSELFQESEKLEIAAMIMMDVDNLKYVNDNFGHDYGDRYLRTVAGVLKNLESKQRIVARISGDEFMMFLYGYQKKEEIIDIVQLLHTQMAESFLMLPNAEKFKIRISGGVAWYPDDSREQNSLIKFADFTMLQTKKNHKGHFDFFAREEYRENRYLVESVDEINHLIDEELVDYFFQPIVNIKTGVIYAHEALMRPYGGTITSPAEALSLARAIGSLYRMERLTWLNSLKKIQQHLSLFGDDGVFFINSIPNQHLSPEDYDFIVAHYAPLLKRTVVEITEDSQITKESQEGFDRLRACGVRMAIDDYGTGFNGQALLLDFQVDYLKIDMSIVRDVSADLNRQDVIQNLVLYGGERGIKIIAEGVETREELETLYRLGVEYVQGFLLQKPSPLPCSLSAEAVEILKSLSEESARKE
ncbi:MAG: bifunctional diguanylate cyclase/phosphodiesterase, partial [Oscillospiraceae bacterium]